MQRADEDPGGGLEALAGVAEEALGVPLDGVLQGAPVHLHRVGRPAGGERPGEDRGAHDEVVGERDLRSHAVDELAHRGDVGLQVARDLLFAAPSEGARLDPLVAILDIHRQKAPDLRPVHGAAPRPTWSVAAGSGARGLRGRGRLSQRPHPQRTLLPVAHGVHERLALGVAILAEQVHLVSELRQRPREAGVVDVRAGPGEEVAVEDQDPRTRASLSTPPPRRSSVFTPSAEPLYARLCALLPRASVESSR